MTFIIANVANAALTIKTTHGHEFPYYIQFVGEENNIPYSYTMNCSDDSNSRDEKIRCNIDYFDIIKIQKSCSVNASHFYQDFAYSQSTHKWVAREFLGGTCRTLKVSILEKSSKSPPVWNYKILKYFTSEDESKKKECEVMFKSLISLTSSLEVNTKIKLNCEYIVL